MNGVSLETLGWGINDWGGSKEGVTDRRGSNILIPHRPGQTWRRKIADSRTLTFHMWVLGCDEDGVTPSGVAAQEAQMLDNWRYLRDLFWGSTSELLSLTKRWDSAYYVATGEAEFAGGLEPVGLGTTAARFTVDLHMPDPYFYGAEDTAQVTTSAATIDNIGHDDLHRLTLDFAGAGSGQYILTNATTGDTLTIDNFGTISVDTWDFTAVKGGSSILGDVTSTNDFWMSLARGGNALDINQGTCDVTWSPAYL